MYSMHSVQTLSNGVGNGIMDPTGTINPAALNSAGKMMIFGGVSRASSPRWAHNPIAKPSQDDTFTSSRICYIRRDHSLYLFG
jgi:hypothetical protein